MRTEGAEWFDGFRGRDEGERRFLAELGGHADAWEAAGVSPADTWAIGESLVPLVLCIDVLTADGLGLQVAYWQKPPMGLAVQGMWTDSDLLLEDERYDQDGLGVFGVEDEPEFFASVAGRWITRQLARPVERLEWIVGKTSVARSLRLADSGTTISRKGAGWWTAIRRAPTTVTTIR